MAHHYLLNYMPLGGQHKNMGQHPGYKTYDISFEEQNYKSLHFPRTRLKMQGAAWLNNCGEFIYLFMPLSHTTIQVVELITKNPEHESQGCAVPLDSWETGQSMVLSSVVYSAYSVYSVYSVYLVYSVY